MILDAIPAGCGARWAFGTVILAFVVVYNEASGPTVIFSAILAAIYGLVSAICKSEIRQLQMPYIRASNKFDFVCLFLALWMDSLAILGACGALARTLSTCLDALTGGLARIFILGRNSPPNEPWPDVLGVTAVFLVTGMFMLGLENTRAFSLLMALGVLGTNGILTAVSTLKGTGEEWDTDYIRPNGLYSFLLAAALSTFAYPSEMPNKQGWKRFQGPLLVLLVCVSSMLSAGCLSTLVHSKYDEIYTAVPIFSILDKVNYHQKLVPAAACLLLLATSGAFLELFTELFSIIVRLATSEWKILTKQISYESPDSGNPVLAIFIGGSLSAMFAFACPMENLTHILAASHLCGGLLRAFYLLYSPFRPKFMQQSCESSLSYSRLSTAATNQNSGSRRSLWNLSIPIQNTLKKSRSNKKLKSKKEVEKEWLLLGEPSSPCPVVRDRDVESSILSDGEPVTSDIEYAEKMDNSDSDTSTDIDAVVDEYKQKIKVTTAGPMEKSIRVPSVASWRLTIFAIVVILFGICLTIFGTFLNLPPAYITGFIGIVLVSVMMSFIPKYTSNAANVAPIISTLTLSLGFLLLAACLPESWPAILFWLVAGFVLAMRCDKWFCMCLDHPATHQIIPSVSGRSAAIRIPRPPKGLMIPGRVQGHR